MFERFTDRARRVVVLSQEEARMLNHNYIGTEHILLGLLSEESGVGAAALGALGVDLESARLLVEERCEPGILSPSGHIPFTPRAKKVMEFSLREALQLGHNYIGTEHLLLALVREGEGQAALVLTDDLNLDLLSVRKVVIDILSGYRAASDSETPPADQALPSGGVPFRVAQVGLKLMESANATLRAQVEGEVYVDRAALVVALHDLIEILALPLEEQ